MTRDGEAVSQYRGRDSNPHGASAPEDFKSPEPTVTPPLSLSGVSANVRTQANNTHTNTHTPKHKRGYFREPGLYRPYKANARHRSGRHFSSIHEARKEFVAQGVTACEVCGWCVPSPARKKPTHLLQIHHIVPRQVGGEDFEDNLVLLCRNCHGLAHSLFTVSSNKEFSRGPVGRKYFLQEMRLFLDHPQGWWDLRSGFVTGTLVRSTEVRP